MNLGLVAGGLRAEGIAVHERVGAGLSASSKEARPAPVAALRADMDVPRSPRRPGFPAFSRNAGRCMPAGMTAIWRS